MIYTFRTTPFKNELKKQFKNVFVFGSLKKDFEIISKKILEEKPNYLIGVANSINKSIIETKTINQFNTNKKILPDAPNLFDLFMPDKFPFFISKGSSDSFCNWTMFKLKNYIEINNLSTKLLFIHLNKKDLPQMKDFLKRLKEK